MAQQNKIGSHATTISNDGKYTIITYHSTQIVKFNDKKIILDTGGWFTSTTKTRMNQTANQFNLGFKIYQKNGEWFCNSQKFDGNTFTIERKNQNQKPIEPGKNKTILQALDFKNPQ